MARITLVTGGTRSGKTAHALQLASVRPDARRVYLATAEASDDEMAARIARHKSERAAAFTTVEEPVNLARDVESLKGRADVIVIDSITLWVANLMRVYSDEAFALESETLGEFLKSAAFDSIIVTDEVGSGIVPDNAVARRYRDLLGKSNQMLARAADEVILMVAGYPVKVK
jgi:adenosylcobinamide kinase/adenosylcobinamide-phosphate guanylyltransferase